MTGHAKFLDPSKRVGGGPAFSGRRLSDDGGGGCAVIFGVPYYTRVS